MDIQFVNRSLKKMFVHKSRNIDQLYDFARQFRIQNIVRDYIEVLL